MSHRPLDVRGRVVLDWGRHRFELVGTGPTVVLRPLTGWTSLAALGYDSLRNRNLPIRALRRSLRRRGLRLGIALRGP